MVRFIEDMDQWKELQELSKSKLVIVDFTASWCGPCQMVAPFYEELSKAFTEVEFVKVDVDEADDVAALNQVSAMPTFQFFSQSKKVGEVMGANLGDLVKQIYTSSGETPPTIRHIDDMDQWNTLMELSKGKLVLVDFTAKWCGPCQMVSPFYGLMANQNKDVEFVKVDVDDADEVAAQCGVQAMPTFQLYKGGKKIDELRGANIEGLKTMVAKHK